jgi:hypothetical protein
LPPVSAEFLSPRVRELRLVDATIDEMSLDADDPNCLFDKFMSLSQGSRVEVDGKSADKFLSICRRLGNCDIAKVIGEKFRKSITTHSAFAHMGTLMDVSPEIEFIASHAYEMSDCLNCADVSMMSEVIGHESLQVESEDWLLEFILRRMAENLEFIGLMECVRFEYLSSSNMSALIDNICELIQELNVCILRRLRERLRCRIWTPGNLVFPPSFTAEWINLSGQRAENITIPDGIIGHLTRECGGNVHDRDIVRVTSSQPDSDMFYDAAKNVVDLRSGSHFSSAWVSRLADIPHQRNNWICYDFKDRRIVPTHYAIRSCHQQLDMSHLKWWLVEVSVDGENWREIDYRENNRRLNGPFETGTFEVCACNASRFIRLAQIGRNHYGNSEFCISGWEIFGSVIE